MSEGPSPGLSLLDLLKDPTGLCVLTAQGEFAFVGPDRRLTIDRALTHQWLEHNHRFLTEYYNDPAAERRRAAILHQTRTAQPWGTLTLNLQDDALRLLYPVSGRQAGELTAFQRRNREKSLFQGMEVMLEYRNDLSPKTVMFCPVLHDRHTTLDRYADWLERGSDGIDRIAPVLEVLNLVATLPIEARQGDRVHHLVAALHRRLIRKDKRQTTGLEIEGGYVSAADPNDIWGNKPRHGDAVHDDSAVTSTQTGTVTTTLKRAKPLAEGEPVSPQRLRFFAHFEHLDPVKLNMIAERAPVQMTPPSAQLLRRGSDDPWNLYLLEGTVSLVAEDGTVTTLEGGTPRARAPLAFLRPRKYTVMALTKVFYISVHDTLLKVVQSSGRPVTSPPATFELRTDD